MIRFLNVFLLLFFFFSCTQKKEKNSDLLQLWIASELLGTQVNFNLDRSTSSSLVRATSADLSELPSRFQDGRPTQIVSAKNFGFDLFRIFLWKKQSLGGVAPGQETIANADVILMDVGKSGSDAPGKVSFRMGEGNLLTASYGYADSSGNLERSWTVSQEWKDPIFDRIGLEIGGFYFELKMDSLASKANRLVFFETKGVSQSFNNPNSIKDRVTVSVNYVMMFPSNRLWDTDKNCGYNSSNVESFQVVGCTGTNSDRYYIDKRTGGPSLAVGDPFVFRSQTDNLTNVPKFSDAEYDSFHTPNSVYPKLPSAILNQLASWEIPNNVSEYAKKAWTNERVLVYSLPETTKTRKKINFNFDASKAFVYQTSSAGSKFEMNEVPKFNYPALGASDQSITLDSSWLNTNGNDYSNWSYSPKNGNQPDPTNGRDFGYFLPKINLNAE